MKYPKIGVKSRIYRDCLLQIAVQQFDWHLYDNIEFWNVRNLYQSMRNDKVLPINWSLIKLKDLSLNLDVKFNKHN